MVLTIFKHISQWEGLSHILRIIPYIMDETKIWKNGYTHRLGYNPYGPMLINGIYNHVYLVGGAITIFKNMKVNGKDYPIYYGT